MSLRIRTTEYLVLYARNLRVPMSQNFYPDDRPAPGEQQPIRARVPDHVSAGAFSTGVIVMTANSEFILDFVQNLGRPHQIVARVVMPHYVLPQLVDALQRNMDLYRSRWGELPASNTPPPTQMPWSADQQIAAPTTPPAANPGVSSQDVFAGSSPSPQSQDAVPPPAAGGSPSSDAPVSGDATNSDESDSEPPGPAESETPAPPPPTGGKTATAQEIYDDLKIRDELLSGAYANAVMIGHGPHEFSFDFITNFYPSSSVSSRVFLSAGQIPRLYESLKGTWEQLRSRQPGGGNKPFNQGPNQNGPDGPAT
jgi:hypothetical protein